MNPPTNPKSASVATPELAPDVVIKIPLPRAPVEDAPPAAPKRTGPPPIPASALMPPASRKPQIKPAEPKLESLPLASAAKASPRAPIVPRSPQSVWAVRIALFVTMGASLGLVYWSVLLRLFPVTNEHRDRAFELTRVADELERLRSRHTPQQIKEIKDRYERARNALVDSTGDLGAWGERLQEQARMRILETTIERDPLKVVVPSANELTALTAQVKIFPNPVYGTTNAPYGRLLKFTEAIANSPKRMDLLELSVTGDSNSVSHATAVVQLFSAEGKPL